MLLATPTSAREPQNAASAPPPTTVRVSRPSSTSHDLLMQQFLDPNFPLEDGHLTNNRSTPVSRECVLHMSAHILRECPRFSTIRDETIGNDPYQSLFHSHKGASKLAAFISRSNSLLRTPASWPPLVYFSAGPRRASGVYSPPRIRLPF